MNRFPFPPYHSGIPHWTERVVSYCAKVLPVVFDNSLSYYEFLGHMQVKLNEVIKALNSQNLLFVEFTHMIELELQNFEKYMEDRQDNFEQRMLDEWDAFKTEIRAEWAAFKAQIEQEWQDYQDEMNEAWDDFKQDLLQRFQTFQDTITAQQTAFEQRMEAVQQQFEDDMENRADTFEQTLSAQQNAFEQNVETELEEWKDVAIRAILDTLRLELPDIIETVLDSDFLAPVISRQGFAKIISAKNPTSTGTLDLTNEPISVFKNGQEVAAYDRLSDLTNLSIDDGTSIMFTRAALFGEVNTGRFQYSANDFPASGYTLSIGTYVSDAQISTEFIDTNYYEDLHLPIEQGSTGFTQASLGRTVWEDVTRTYQYITIRFLSASAAPAFTADYSQGVELYKPPIADLVVEDQRDGSRYSIPKNNGSGGGITRTYITDITLTFQQNQYERRTSSPIQIADLTNFDAIEIAFKDLMDDCAKCEILPIDLLGSNTQLVSSMVILINDNSTTPPTVLDYFHIATLIYKDFTDNHFYADIEVVRNQNLSLSQSVSISLHGISGINQQ